MSRPFSRLLTASPPPRDSPHARPAGGALHRAPYQRFAAHLARRDLPNPAAGEERQTPGIASYLFARSKFRAIPTAIWGKFALGFSTCGENPSRSIRIQIPQESGQSAPLICRRLGECVANC